MTRDVVTVVGGGSVAHALVAVLGAQESTEVRVLTRRPAEWGETVRGYYRSGNGKDLIIEGRVARASDDPAEVIPGSQVLMVAAPFPAHREILEKIRPHVTPEMVVGGFPGFGGFDWQARWILGRDAPSGGPTLFGLQRIPYVSHKIAYGHKVAITGIRPQLFIAALPAHRAHPVAELLHRLLHTRVVPTGNYLNITLSTSNPIMHPARLYTLFRHWRPGLTYEQRPYFYRDWDEESTLTYLRCDAELHDICRALPLDLGYVKPLVQHYEVATQEDITPVIQGLPSLGHRRAPMRLAGQVGEEETDQEGADQEGAAPEGNGGGWEPDPASWYFTEDIPYGIVLQRAVAEIAGVPTPTFDAIIRWAQELMGKEYLVDGRVAGRDAAELPIPQRYGISTVEELVRRALS